MVEDESEPTVPSGPCLRMESEPTVPSGPWPNFCVLCAPPVSHELLQKFPPHSKKSCMKTCWQVVLSLIYLKGMIMQPGGLFLTEFTDLVLKNYTGNLRVQEGGTVSQVTKIPLHSESQGLYTSVYTHAAIKLTGALPVPLWVCSSIKWHCLCAKQSLISSPSQLGQAQVEHNAHAQIADATPTKLNDYRH